MKYLDDVKLVRNHSKYKIDDIDLGEIGTIIEPMIRDNAFYIIFDNEENGKWFKYAMIEIEDLEIVNDAKISDKEILEALPKKNPKWWCKVENGYIINLLGEKKNKIPYDYNS